MISLSFDRRLFGRAMTRSHYNAAALAQCWARMTDIDLQHATREAFRLETPFAKRRLASRYARALRFSFRGDDRDLDEHVAEMFDAPSGLLMRGDGA